MNVHYPVSLRYTCAATMMAMLLSSGCKKKEDETPIEVPVATLAEYHFKGTIDGVTYVYEISSGNHVTMMSIADNQNINGTEMFRFGAEMDAQGSNTSLPFPVVVVSLQTLKQLTTDVTDPDFFSFIKKGNYPYVDNFVLGENGAIVELVDKNGSFYYSSDGAQAGSSFNITVATPKAATIGNVAKVKATIQFNCKVYDIVGNAINIDNAELVIDIENPY